MEQNDKVSAPSRDDLLKEVTRLQKQVEDLQVKMQAQRYDLFQLTMRFSTGTNPIMPNTYRYSY